MTVRDFPAFKSFRSVALLSAREMFRSRFTAGVILLTFALVLGLFAALDLLFGAGGPGPGALLYSNFGVIAAMGAMSIAFPGTAVLLVQYRELGTLRLLAATPVTRIVFIIGQLPARAGLAVAELLILLGVMFFGGTSSFVSYATVLLAGILGFIMLMSLGILLGARGANTELTRQLSLLLPIVVIFTSGAGLPLSSFPGWVQDGIQFLPTTWYMAAVNNWFVPDPHLIPHLVGLAGVAVAVTAVTTSVFDWGEERRHTRRGRS
ncbi:ABC transporter permease [Leucobacter sp. NPDC015123]|uniref:ABC transporter permease n=1 Tax=Leucobacter sp. NPDC015123 TaxID=3364129 RepID=UPI0036F461AE